MAEEGDIGDVFAIAQEHGAAVAFWQPPDMDGLVAPVLVWADIETGGSGDVFALRFQVLGDDVSRGVLLSCEAAAALLNGEHPARVEE